MSRKRFYQRKHIDESKIQGFDIELNKDATHRIDRLVDRYEDEILNHLNEDYTKRTSWPERLAYKIAAFGGSWRFNILWCVFNRLDDMEHDRMDIALAF